MAKKLIKIKVGEFWERSVAHPVFLTAFERVSKDGKTTYYVAELPIFISEIKEKEE